MNEAKERAQKLIALEAEVLRRGLIQAENADVSRFKFGENLWVRSEFGAQDEDMIFMSQRATAIRINDMIDLSATLLAIHLGHSTVDPLAVDEARVGARDQKKHVESYIRMRQRKDLDPAITRLGGKIDTMLIRVSQLLLDTIDLYELPGKLKIRRDFVEETERRRRERIEAKKLTKEMRAAKRHQPPPAPLPKREKEDRPPPCDKCGKRPRVSGTLCAKCAEWMMRR
jgi:hypothetical protein